MDDHSLLVTMSVFVFVSAVALLIQAGFLFGIYKATRALQDNVTRLMPRVETLITSSQAAVEDGRVRIAEITTKTNAILDVTNKQLQTVESLLNDVSDRARVQMDRAEMFLDDTMDKAQDTVTLVHSSVIAPIRQINGLASGIRAALQFLLRGNRPSPDRATVDEEMFI
jgi:ABC-type transporter Mla subunit MlaD